MNIRKGTESDLKEISMLYDFLNDYLNEHINYPGWKKGVYPIEEDAERGIAENALYVVEDNQRIAGTFILRHKPEEAYAQADWKVDISYDDITVLYTFAVHPDYLNQGIGNTIMDFVIEEARKNNQKAIRLDVYEKNEPAIHLYEKKGFEHIATIDLGYSSYGLPLFNLYQKLLS